MNRFFSGLAVASLGLSLACRPEAAVGIVTPPPPPPPLESLQPLAVEVYGVSRVLRPGTYFYQATASGGSGEYQFRWEVSSGPVAAAVRTEPPETVTYVTPDGYYMLHIGSGDGDLMVRVTVTAGSEQTTRSIFVRNCIGGCAP